MPLDHNQTGDMTAGVSVTLENAPPDVRTLVGFDYYISGHAVNVSAAFYSGDATNAAPVETGTPLATYSTGGAGEMAGHAEALTDASDPPVIKYRTESGAGSTSMKLLVRHWQDRRGRG